MSGVIGNFFSGWQTRQKRRAAHRVGHQGLDRLNRQDFEGAEKYLEAALAMFHELGDEPSVATTLTHLASVCQSTGRLEQAEVRLNEAIGMFEQQKDHDGVATATSNLGIIGLGRGEFDDAEKCFRRAMKLYEKAGNREGVAHSEGGIGLAFLGKGAHADAIKWIDKSVHSFEAIDQRHGLAPMLVNLGEAHAETGELDAAADHWEHAQEIYRSLKAEEIAVALQKKIDAAREGWVYDPENPDAKAKPRGKPGKAGAADG